MGRFSNQEKADVARREANLAKITTASFKDPYIRGIGMRRIAIMEEIAADYRAKEDSHGQHRHDSRAEGPGGHAARPHHRP